MNGDAESLKESYPLFLVSDAEAGQNGVNYAQTPHLRLQNIRKLSLRRSGRI